ncbi:amidohydrolase [Haloglomus litoreum]|uniref:amidohydrolase n=1 Tax=Haloglomus litoreum TaxID=3034026 RepID=UPI0023E8E22A|nr:amidohydrolase [Haloglomus sp. DT116]
MTPPADRILTNAEVHTLAPDGGEPAGRASSNVSDGDTVHEAVAVRDGRVVRVGSAYEVAFLRGVETTVHDCGGRVVLPGFVDAHTHLDMVGRYLVHAALGDATGPADAIERLVEGARAPEESEWILGFGYDESTWDDARYLTREDLDRVSEERPVAAFREDVHTVSLNGVALARLGDDIADENLRRAGGEPTGVAVEGAVGTVLDATRGDQPECELLRAASDRAAELGITAVGDMVRDRRVPRAYRDLARDGELGLRVRLNYWTDFLDALEGAGLRTDDGDDLVRVGAVKSYTDGSLGARTARLSEPYADADTAGTGDGPEDGGAGSGDGEEARGQWVVTPDELREYVERADALGLQFCAHAIGDEAIAATLDAYAETDAAAARHRVEHAEVLTGDLVERFAEVGAVASVQPNFLKWAREGGLYESRLGRERTRASNRYAALREAGVPLAFGSDTMPLGPLFGVQQAVTAPAEAQRLDVTDALRAYTRGAAYALRDEDRFGVVEPGKQADLVVLDESPWNVAPDAIADIDVAATLVGGELTYRGSDF